VRPDSNVHYYEAVGGHFINSISEYSGHHGVHINDSSPTIHNSMLTNNATHGLYISHGMYTPIDSLFTPIISNNTFINNDGYGALAVLTFVDLSYCFSNTGSGNGINGFGITGDVRFSQTWSYNSETFPYVVDYYFWVTNDATLTIPAGVIIKFKEDSSYYGFLQVTSTGTLDVNGEAGNEVVFTSFSDDSYGGDTNGDGTATAPAPGDWYMLRVSGTGTFDHARIR
jgi:hypothetical protein